MRILAIRGRNLASLAGEFEIDFQAGPLAGAGLFAITGPTGAGKSTLLDALCLALYERTPRLARAAGKGEIPDVGDNGVSPSDPRTILRRGAAEGFAEVDYLGSDGVAYRSRWSVRRSRSKSDGKLQNSEVSFMRLLDRQVLSEHRKTETLRLIEASIGLNFEQFTRAVLLAQNEFAAFLRASDDERAELLQTLTGTETFTLISQQAFARMKAEKEQLERLQAQMQDQTPLAPELRAEQEAQLLAQGQAVQALEASRSLDEGQLRWYAQHDALGAAVADAQGKLAAATAEREAAQGRHDQLSLLDSVQAARPLRAELDRLTPELAAAEGTAAAAQSALAAHGLALDELALQHAATQQQLAGAEAQTAAAQPLLHQARELDASVAALEPQWQAAVAAREQAKQQQQTLDLRRAEVAMRLEQSNAELSLARDWLSANVGLRALSEGWPRWDTLFGNAQQHLAGRDRAAAAVQQLGSQVATLATAQQAEQAALLQAGDALAAAQQRLEACSRDCAAVDPDALALQKGRFAQRREQLQAAAQLWQQRVDAVARKAQLEQQRTQQTGLLAQGQAQQAQAQAQQPLLERELAAAQGSLDIARLAASSGAKSLRAGLQADAPCPVCGATEHPYADHSPQSDAIIGALQQQLTNKRRTLDLLLQTLSAAAERCAAAGAQIVQIERELQDLQQDSARRQADWQAQALHPELAELDPAHCSAWLAAQQAQASAELERVAGEEKSHRERLRLKDQAQAALAPLQRALDSARAALDRSTLQQHKTEQELQVQQRSAAELARQLDQVQALLDAAFPDPAWRDHWARDADAFVAQSRASANEWATQQQQEAALAGQIQTLGAEVAGCEAACEQAAQHLRSCLAQAEALELQVDARRSQRKLLFDGIATVEVESSLTRRLAAARQALQSAQARLQLAQSDCARMTESQRQAEALLERLRRQLAAAGDDLRAWLAAFNAAQSSEALPSDELARLLAVGADWVARERRALQALGSALASAQAVLQEHLQALARHESAKTAQHDADGLRERLAQTNAALAEAAQALTSIRIAIAQDDERLNRSLSLRAQIEQQSARSRVWSQLSELIGSADGKKFRNFAQQLTLDILLGYANQHLHSLSRRYRLQRITDSLGLLVVDQDMGDELRSVHSLSGGESFLVSLALALGLASLSSHRVRVESLFIDEGFGSLDTESLRVAMDALDNLQALGRKVGVISHVQEMTERIGTRINVTRMAAGQSRVTVS